jgi:hypothetical protein
MKSANNSALFTDVSAEESSTLNGGAIINTGRVIYRPEYRQRVVFNRRTGRYTPQWYVHYQPIWVPR